MKSGKLIYDLDQSFSEYVNKKNGFELFGELENTLHKKINLDKQNLENPYEAEFANSLVVEHEEKDTAKISNFFFFKGGAQAWKCERLCLLIKTELLFTLKA